MTLYDWHLNSKLECDTGSQPLFTLDDIDQSFENVLTVKFHEHVKITTASSPCGYFNICAYPAGRTIGGAAWSIRLNSAEVFYMMDINLRKEIVLEGCSLDALPISPSVMIIEGGCACPSRTQSKHVKKLKDRDDLLVSSVLEAVRRDGNVLIPSESCGRSLEIIQVLSKHWSDHKLDGMYHLVFLSPMAKNIVEFAKSQLEWMSPTLSRSFYLGKPNPFFLPSLKLCTSLREMEAIAMGPKVVITTDASLTCGLAKELLIRWGGDPRCAVIFADQNSEYEIAGGTLANEIRSQINSPPIIAMISKPEKVLLVGDELAAYMQEQDLVQRQAEENETRRRKENVLAQVIL
jgi:cleavage and polyadenylation specificity factor subunit 2